MTLHPIAVVNHVLDEYRDHITTEFRARDPHLRAALLDALDQPCFLAQEPFFQAHRAFQSGAKWADLPLDAGLAKVMRARTHEECAFLHQATAITHLLGEQAAPLVVTTGTGSGKTECFLLPVIQNAIEDATRFNKRAGLTAILVYPMNALANDQEERIRDLLQGSGHTYIEVARYDRSTKQAERERLRRNPPHILLTNYMMLEYLLVRPADRDALFANHRCRYIVLDEVHTYRGSLGANIALLFRRLLAHLRNAPHDWNADNRGDLHRFPAVVPVATSATIKSVDETGRTPEEVTRLRDEAVQEFFAKLTGVEAGAIRVVGETLRALEVPTEARWTPSPVAVAVPDPHDPRAVRQAVAALAGLPADTGVATAGRTAAILWKLNDLLARKPLSVTGIVQRIREEVPERREADETSVRREVDVALVAGAALPDGTPGALRLRTHRFVRGGWKFYRCVDPSCGRLYAMGEEHCTCGKATAPLYLCRTCGADVLRFSGKGEGDAFPLVPNEGRGDDDQWILYDASRYTDMEDEGLAGTVGKQMQERLVLGGSFDPGTLVFSRDVDLYPVRAILAPERNRCLVCDSRAGSRNVITPVSMGTSAAVRVLSEGLVEALADENATKPEHDHKERLLIFSDSRQDAAHQARFITYAGRYDRMRRRLVRILEEKGGSLSLADAVSALMARGVEAHDNPHTATFSKVAYLNDAVKNKALAWEEAPLLDDLAVSAGYRATVFNLGLVAVRYQRLDTYVQEAGADLAARLGISLDALEYVCRSVLDEMRRRGALSRPMLRYHPSNPNCPDDFRGAADWERKVPHPQGYACADAGKDDVEPVGSIDEAEVPDGITRNNFWRAERRSGGQPSQERRFRALMARLGGVQPTEDLFLAVIGFLMDGPHLVIDEKLFGYRQTRRLLQVNADCIELVLVKPEHRFHCSTCGRPTLLGREDLPCAACSGSLKPWSDAEVHSSRYVQRILKANLQTLVAGEHTAQISGDERIVLEDNFKARPETSRVNVLACSPTLEMGIDVGGLDAVVMRNVPPRPDNYAQRGGRAGRRTRVGVVVGYARSTPHDGYFYDKPEEMIAGEVPAPGIGLGNRDVVLRHLHAVAIGTAAPGLSGRMETYVNLQGELQVDAIDGLIAAIDARFPDAADLALTAWGATILEPAGLETREKLLDALAHLPARVRDLFDRVCLQIHQLDEVIRYWTEQAKGGMAAQHAMKLKCRLLGIRGDKDKGGDEADDRSGGNPMRRFAEFGILPGYEFPSEPSTLRLLGDTYEEEPITVERRFGIAQYQPDARVHARGHRWKVVGLDQASPWNPKTPEPTWTYVRCAKCGLRYGAQAHVNCPRCRSDQAGGDLPGYEYGGFVARRDDTPVLEEEDRFAIASLVTCHPQWDGQVVARYRLATGWSMQVRRGEEIRWVNEWKKPTPKELEDQAPILHEEGRGFYLCSDCGRILHTDAAKSKGTKGRKRAAKVGEDDPFGHAKSCSRTGQPPNPHAITAHKEATTLRVVVDLPHDMAETDYRRWGYSLGYALRMGLRHLYMLDGPEVDFELEPMWEKKDASGHRRVGALTFLDAAVGGSGFLDRAAAEFHLVARRAVEHLDHAGCDSACYRCLKSYTNQRIHEHLNWPLVLPDLDHLATAAPEPMPLQTGDADDPRPWLDAFDAGVGSPLELKFLRLFEEHGLPVKKQVAVAPAPGGRAISTADFQIEDSRVLLYVDGASVHRGERLRRDRYIRQRLREGTNAWQVIELRAADHHRGAELITWLRGLAHPGGK